MYAYIPSNLAETPKRFMSEDDIATHSGKGIIGQNRTRIVPQLYFLNRSSRSLINWKNIQEDHGSLT